MPDGFAFVPYVAFSWTAFIGMSKLGSEVMRQTSPSSLPLKEGRAQSEVDRCGSRFAATFSCDKGLQGCFVTTVTFPRRYRMHAGIPALGPAYMQAPSGEVNVVPAQCHQLRGPETMAVSDQDSRGVPMPRAVLLRGLNEAPDLPVGEIFTAALANRYNLLRLEPLREAASFPWPPACTNNAKL
jgi:hypothetical protein